MSIKVMTMVFDRYPVGGSERLLALAMADHARDDGSRIWPSIDELARKTMQSRSTVQRQIAKMLGSGWLEKVSDRTGRGNTNEYRICPAWIEGGPLPSGAHADAVTDAAASYPQGCQIDTLSADQKGVIQNEKGVTQDVKGVIAMTPESSEPSRTITPLPPSGGADGFEALYREFPNKANRAKAARRYARIAPDGELLARMLAAVAAQRRTPKWAKDGGEFVPELATWLRNEGWRDAAAAVMPDGWWQTSDGVKRVGAELGMAYTLAPLGNAYTDDQVVAHWRAYRTSVLAAAGPGPWAERRAA